MNSPDLLLGLGSVIYSLTLVDGKLQKEEVRTLRDVLAEEPHGDVALCGFYLRQKFDYSVSEAYETGLHRIMREGILLNRETRKRFVGILLKVAKAHDGISRSEREFIRRFWRELLPTSSRKG